MKKGIDCKGKEWKEIEIYGKMIDATGLRFGNLVALFPVRCNGKVQWLCQCDCGNQVVVTYNHLNRGNTKSCGCYHKEVMQQRYAELRESFIGQTFGRLTVIEFIGVNEHKDAIYKFQCSCGNIVIKPLHDVKDGGTKSCGCLRQDNVDIYKTDIIGMKFGHLTVLSYVGVNKHKNTVFQCLCDCGEVVTVSRNSLTTGHTKSCGCIISVGENNIKHILKCNGIKYKSQYIFQDLVSNAGRVLPYDFAILDDNDQAIKLIEFDGSQHERPYDYFGGEEKFKRVQENDALKNQYALAHHIPLVRIPYSSRDVMTLQDLMGSKYLIT